MFLFMRRGLFFGLGICVGLSGMLYGGPPGPVVARRQAAFALGQSKDPSQAGPKLLAALDDKDDMTREIAARSLGNLKYAPASARLGAVLAGDHNDVVRQAAAVSLRLIGDPQAVPALSRALRDPSVIVRVTALAGIAHYKDVKARPAV